jgi:hypothetical protein
MSLLSKLTKDGTFYRNPQTGGKPTGALTAGSPPPINNTFSKGQYELYVLDTKEIARAKDLTAFSANQR